jgi:hypothetical protein
MKKYGRSFTRLALIGCLALSMALPAGSQDQRGVEVISKALGVSPGAVGKYWAVFIAVDGYHHWAPLSNPVKDAQEIRDILTRGYYLDEVRELFNEAATAANIRRLFVQLRRDTGKQDSVFVFYAGHGHIDEVTNSGFWIPVDGGLDPYKQDNWLANTQIRNMLDILPAKHVFLAADACFSGEILETNRGGPGAFDKPYYERAYRLVSRQVLTSGARESVPDKSEFAQRLKGALERAEDAYIDPEYLHVKVREIQRSQPLLGYIAGSAHEQGGSFVFVRRAEEQEAEKAGGVPVRVDTGTVQVSSGVAGVVVVDGEDSGVRVKEGGSVSITVTSGRTEVGVRKDGGALILAPPVVVQAGQSLRVRVQPLESDENFVISSSTLVAYRGKSNAPEIPWGITEIGAKAFYEKPIRSVSIPASVTAIGDRAFSTAALQVITVDSRNRSFTAVDGVLFDKAMKMVHTYPRGKGGSHYTIPASVTAIGEEAFADCKNLGRVELSRKTQVANGAFQGSPLVELHYRD